jgi:4-azaleucine resistance transporter AzlC
MGACGDARAERYIDGVRDAVRSYGYTRDRSLAFGVVAKTAGVHRARGRLMSLILYAGSAQFVTVGLIAAGEVPPGRSVVTFLLVNVRHLLYSAAISTHVRHLKTCQNALIGAELTDETFALASGRLGRGAFPGAGWFLGLNNASHAAWILCTSLGAVAGGSITDTRALGFDFALAAMFAALLVLQIAGRPKLHAAVAARRRRRCRAVCALIRPRWAIVTGHAHRRHRGMGYGREGGKGVIVSRYS